MFIVFSYFNVKCPCSLVYMDTPVISVCYYVAVKTVALAATVVEPVVIVED